MGRPRYSGMYRRMLQRLIGVEPTEKETIYQQAINRKDNMKLLIWTEAYQPFIMGGDVNAPIATEIEIPKENIHKLSKDIDVVVICSPKGAVRIAELSTGAFVGTSLTDVTKDVENASQEVMLQQLEQAKKRVKKARHVTNEHFWDIVDKN